MSQQLTRAEILEAHRLNKPRSELDRKARKAVRRQRIWTAEELEAAEAKAKEMQRNIKWE